MFSEETIVTSKKILSTVASLTASAVLLKTITSDLIPNQIREYFSSSLQKFSTKLSSQLTVVIDEFDGLTPNHMFSSSNAYLSTKISPSTRRFKLNKPEKEKTFSIVLDNNEEIIDVFEGVKFKWLSIVSCRTEQPSIPARKQNNNSVQRSEIRCFELTFHRKHREVALTRYLPYIIRRAKEIREDKKTIKLHTIDYHGMDYWGSVNFDHPATFETIAMDLDTRKFLIEDLNLFMERKEYYRRVGKAWKRGYLLYGPPGTGKSSLVAAMANYLRFDVYDLDLREVQCNSDLRRLLIGTGSRSIIVIEDIDCSVELQNREDDPGSARAVDDEKVTLSALLNFIDGLWSSCGDERIIVFTTNHKDRLDPALLRPGRMDVHINMSYCTFGAFKVLASSYLGIEDHAFYAEIETLLGSYQATPAEITGELMKGTDADYALKQVIKFLQSKAIM